MDFKTIAIGAIIGILIGSGIGYALNLPNITKLQSQLDTLETKIASLQDQIEVLEAETVVKDSEISSLKEQIQLHASEVSTSSYIIFKEGATYYVWNGMTGGIDYSSTDAVTVVQAAINSLTHSRISTQKITCLGDYTIANTISIPNYTELEIYGRWTMANNANVDMFNICDGADNWYSAIDGNAILDGNKGNNTSGTCISDDGSHSPYRLRLQNLLIKNFKEYGINLYRPYVCWFDQIECSENEKDGMYIISSVDRSKSTRCEFTGNSGNGLHFGSSCMGWSDVGSTITANGKNGLLIEAGAHQLLFDGTRFQDNSISSNNTYANIYCPRGAITFQGIQCYSEYSPPYPSYDYEEFNTSGAYHNIISGFFKGSNGGFSVIDWGYLLYTNFPICYYSGGWIARKTINSGQATILKGQSSVTVLHNLFGAPRIVEVTGTDSDVANLYVTNINATAFIIHSASAVGGNRTILWDGKI
ncbi:MAG: Pectate lyase 3 protein [Thermoproteota archaeon]|nr:Pectate lyase 3 protein [Thermoproteota archaeon]